MYHFSFSGYRDGNRNTDSVPLKANRRYPVYVGMLVSAGIFLPEIFLLFNQAEKIFQNYIEKEKTHTHTHTKVNLVKAMVFPVVMYGCESWTINKAEHRTIDAFELWFWRRLLRVPWTAKRSNQSILKEISPEYSLEGVMLKLKLQYFGHLIRGTD